MKARFIGDPNDGGSGAAEVNVFGVDFVKDVWREVPEGFPLHSHFEYEVGEDLSQHPLAAPARDPFDHDGDGKPGGSLPGKRRGRPPKAK